jgi:carbon-monoxide dehydrogenase iron sulfur subunit
MELETILNRHKVNMNDIEDIQTMFTLKKYEPEKIVFEEGDFSDKLYFIKSGQVLIRKKNLIGDDEPNSVLGEGDLFGEIGFLENSERIATAITFSKSEIYELDKKGFNRLVKISPSFQTFITNVGRIWILSNIPLFREMDEKTLVEINNHLTEKEYDENSIVYQENDLSDALYIIIKGSVKISKRVNTTREVSIIDLDVGHLFGALGLIENQARSSTVTTAAPTKLLVLTDEDFQDIVNKYPTVLFNMMKILSNRLREYGEQIRTMGGTQLFKGMTIVSRSDKCLSCRACEMACAVAKSKSLFLYEAIHEERLPVKRIHVRKVQSGSEPVIRPEYCLHCKNAPCLVKCKFNAIKRDPALGTITILEDSCTGCGLCIKACPFNVITLIRPKGKKRLALKCTHCAEHQSGPACVRSCPTNALTIALAPKTAL